MQKPRLTHDPKYYCMRKSVFFILPQVALTAASPAFRGFLTQFDTRLPLQRGACHDDANGDQVRYYHSHNQRKDFQ